MRRYRPKSVTEHFCNNLDYMQAKGMEKRAWLREKERKKP
jgi:hypothetical protein